MENNFRITNRRLNTSALRDILSVLFFILMPACAHASDFTGMAVLLGFFLSPLFVLFGLGLLFATKSKNKTWAVVFGSLEAVLSMLWTVLSLIDRGPRDAESALAMHGLGLFGLGLSGFLIYYASTAEVRSHYLKVFISSCLAVVGLFLPTYLGYVERTHHEVSMVKGGPGNIDMTFVCAKFSCSRLPLNLLRKIKSTKNWII